MRLCRVLHLRFSGSFCRPGGCFAQERRGRDRSSGAHQKRLIEFSSHKTLNPRVSLIIPCYNEEKTITPLLESIAAQTFPLSDMEVIIADGLSSDKTREKITAFRSIHPNLNLQVIDNPKRIIPAALNAAIQAASGELIMRMDAHTIPANDYVEKSVRDFDAGKGENIGGVIDIRPGSDTWIGRSIAVATRHPLGVGDARYRWTKTAGYADTVAFGLYAKATFEKIGLYNESLIANEDYEMNARLRASGGRIWINPEIRSTYYSRPTLKKLARQYFNYGFYKYRMLQKFPRTLRWRQALPPLFVFSILMLLLISTFWWFARITLLCVAAIYLLILIAGSSKESINQKAPQLLIGIPLVIMTMHFSWGSGFLWSAIKSIFKENHAVERINSKNQWRIRVRERRLFFYLVISSSPIFRFSLRWSHGLKKTGLIFQGRFSYREHPSGSICSRSCGS
jgi:glycosyltransferase involved in cell wall biosynthesis